MYVRSTWISAHVRTCKLMEEYTNDQSVIRKTIEEMCIHMISAHVHTCNLLEEYTNYQSLGRCHTQNN